MVDPSDPLSLLIADPESQDQPPLSDWSHLSVLWPTPLDDNANMKYPDLGFNMDLDMDYNPSMAIEPSSLHLESGAYQQPFLTPMTPITPVLSTGALSNELFSAPSFPFTFSSDESSAGSSFGYGDNRPRRLSMTSSDSSSGASLSPVIESRPTFLQGDQDPVEELAQRARQSVGVMLAVPTVQAQPKLSIPIPAQPKLPIPRLPRPGGTKSKRSPQPKSEPSSTASTPPPSDCPENPPSETAVPTTSTSTIGRPKTNHTTIERRYRTNLNARILSLRQAVPALRVLEDKGKPRKDGEAQFTDVIDERGFVDGVKVARKCSKANVLGKAVEYIRVLKRRELRLTREQNGLKSLICGLVGGPALLKEWEREWKEKFGGQEKDEIESEGAEPLSDDDEDDEDDGDESGSKDSSQDSRAKKKVKLAKKEVATPPSNTKHNTTTQSVVPEKRKRGRPRKILSGVEEVPRPKTSFAQALTVADDQMIVVQPNSSAAQTPQYLLATFALFSFFNSPIPSYPSSSPQAKTGVVVGHSHVHKTATVGHGSGWRDIVTVVHLIVSALLFLSIVGPWLPVTFKRVRLVQTFSSFLSTTTPKAQPITQKDTIPPSLVDVLKRTFSNPEDEAAQLRSALGVGSGLGGLLQVVFGRRRGKGPGFERRSLEQRAWVRLGELAVLDCKTSLLTRFQTYWSISSYLSWFTASTSDLSTLALVIQPLSNAKAISLWDHARKAQVVRPFERLVLDKMGVEEAAERVGARVGIGKYSPIAVLAEKLVLERMKRHAAVLFVTAVPGKVENGWKEDEEEEEEERKVTIGAANALGGQCADLAEVLERVWKVGVCEFDDVGLKGLVDEDGDVDEQDGEDGDPLEEEIKSLLSALILYRRMFPSSIVLSSSGTNPACTGIIGNGTIGTSGVSIMLSPPPSPSRKNVGMQMALRRMLGARVFDCFDVDGGDASGGEGGEGEGDGDGEGGRLGAALEDARDRVVDVLVDAERQGRFGKREFRF